MGGITGKEKPEKEKLEKEQKEGDKPPKESKEGEKGKEGKELPEKPAKDKPEKESREGAGISVDSPSVQDGTSGALLGKERHFITRRRRPNLVRGALVNEPDVS